MAKKKATKVKKIEVDDLIRKKPKYPNQELLITLPMGVSVNHLYMFKKGKRFMTKAGEQYMKDVMMLTTKAVEEQGYKPEPPGVWMVAELTFYYGDKRRRDCHNQHKLIMDALECIAFEDDRWVLVRDMHVALDKDNPRVEVRIYPEER